MRGSAHQNKTLSVTWTRRASRASRPRMYVDKKSGATTDRPGLRALLDYARGGDVIVVHTLDRLGRTVRDTLNLIHELSERGVGVRNLADPIRIDSTDPGGPMAQLAVVLLALFAQMGTHLCHRACRARPRGGHGQEPPHRAADQRGRGQVGLGGAPARLRRGPVGDPGGTRAARGMLPEPGNSPPAPPAFGLGAAGRLVSAAETSTARLCTSTCRLRQVSDGGPAGPPAAGHLATLRARQPLQLDQSSMREPITTVRSRGSLK